ncbi:MAG: hypothetical protein HY586_07270, partial [Candidatus Omnitrophica bacterium]|nr:hypothetical protein [Candidatus Omnitrophota bacterium]
PLAIAGVLSAEALRYVGPSLNLPPLVTEGLAILTSTLGGGFANPGSSFGEVMKNITPSLVGQFSALGVTALGQAVGLDPRLTALIGVGVGAVASGLTQGIINQNTTVIGYRSDGTPIEVTGNRGVLDYVQDSVLRANKIGTLVSVGANINIGLDALGAPPIARDFVTGFLGSVIGAMARQPGEGGGSGAPSEAEVQAKGEGLLSQIGSGIKKFGQGVLQSAEGVVSFGAKVLGTAGQFTADAFRGALAGVAGFFSPATQENIYQDIAGVRQGTITESGGVWTWQSGESRVVYNSNYETGLDGGAAVGGIGGKLSESAAGVGEVQITGLGMNDAGNYYYEGLGYQHAEGERFLSIQNYERGRLRSWGYENVEGGPSILVEGPYENVEGGPSVFIGGPANEDFSSAQPLPKNGRVSVRMPATFLPNWEHTIDFQMRDGSIYNAEVRVTPVPGNNSPGESSEEEPEDLYVLVNGIMNDRLGSSPEYLFNFREDIVEESQNKVKREDIILAPTFFATWASKLLDILGYLRFPLQTAKIITAQSLGAMLTAALKISGRKELTKSISELMNGTKDVFEFIKESMDPNRAGKIAEEIEDALEAHFAEESEDRLRSITAVAYSGGFLPLAEILVNNPYDVSTGSGYNTQSLVGLGAATFKIGEMAQALVDKTASVAAVISTFVRNVSGVADAVVSGVLNGIQGGLEEMAQLGAELGMASDAASTYVVAVMDRLRSGLYSEAYDTFERWIQAMMGNLEAAEPLDMTVSDELNVVVNVYGTEDILTQMGIEGNMVAGYRTEIGGFVVGNQFQPLVNIEIKGASHFDYMRQENFDLTQAAGLGGSFGLGAALTQFIGLDHLDAYGGPLGMGLALHDLMTGEDRAWNERVANFVADMVGHSQTVDDLKRFMDNDAKTEHGATIEGNPDHWIIHLPGSEDRK